MDKLKNMTDAISKIKDKDTVIIGTMGNDELSKAIFKSLAGIQAKDLTFVTMDPAINADPNFKEVLSKHAKALITPSVEQGAVPSNVSCEISAEDILIERVRAGGSGIPAFFVIGNGSGNEKEKRTIDGKECVKETAIAGDVTIFRAKKADEEGNSYLPAGPMKKYNMYIPFASKYVISIADEVVSIGQIEPEYVTVSGILVEAVVKSSSLQK